jgi:hemerythrin
MSIEWKSDFAMGILELDVQQQELFTKFENFSAEVEKGNGHKKVEAFLTYLDHYARQHFTCEEHLQDRGEFPGREEHAAAHRRFVNELESLKSALASGKNRQELALAVKGMMIRWVITHSKQMDLEFNDHLLAATENTKWEMVTKKLGEILVNSKLVSRVTIERALLKQQESGSELGLILVEMGVVNQKEIEAALLAQEGKTPFSGKLGQILVESGVIAYETLERALERQKPTGKLLGAILIEMGVADLHEVISAQAVQKGMLQRMS